MFQIDKSHAGNPKRIISTCTINPCFAVAIRIFRIIGSQTVINKMQTVNAEVLKFYGTYAWVSLPFNVECGTFTFLHSLFYGQVCQYPASPRPDFMEVCPFFLQKIIAYTWRNKTMSWTLDFQVTDIDKNLCPKMIISWRNINHCTRFSSFVDICTVLPAFNIFNYTVDYLSNIFIRISNIPLRYIIIILASHWLCLLPI